MKRKSNPDLFQKKKERQTREPGARASSKATRRSSRARDGTGDDPICSIVSLSHVIVMVAASMQFHAVRASSSGPC